MSKIDDVIELQKQSVKVVECEDCNHLMVNLDADQLAQGDLVTLKRLGLRVSNPETKEAICIKCEIEKTPTFKEKLSDWFESDDDDDTPFFHSTPSIPTFGGSSILGGFGGFGGGSFSGGGASRSF